MQTKTKKWIDLRIKGEYFRDVCESIKKRGKKRCGKKVSGKPLFWCASLHLWEDDSVFSCHCENRCFPSTPLEGPPLLSPPFFLVLKDVQVTKHARLTFISPNFSFVKICVT